MTRWNVLTLAPPLIVTEDELRTGRHALDEALAIADRYAATGSGSAAAKAAARSAP